MSAGACGDKEDGKGDSTDLCDKEVTGTDANSQVPGTELRAWLR